MTSQNNLEFWTEYSDMITEKLDEIQNAKAKLQEIKTQYLKKKNSEKMEDLNAWFLQTDGNGIPEFSQQDSSDKINLHSEKIDLKMKLLSQTKKIARSQKICDLNYDSDSDSERKANENYQEMIKAKSEFFEAVDGILLEIEDEFKNIRVILRKISELQKKSKYKKFKCNFFLHLDSH